jgi:hypothetical protein
MLSIYSEYISDTSMIFGAFSKNAQKKFFNGFYLTFSQMIPTRSSSKKVLYTDCLSMAEIWARSETLAGIVDSQVRFLQTSSLKTIVHFRSSTNLIRYTSLYTAELG